ncbi:hypothetical protein [Janthinobacterium sp. RB2R34]|uniref:hypothetical protein n=1 Tax=Janthinobacterium sp. RB2R34 TaxID=3424193 RepID=UPI003F1ED44C
MNQLTLALPFGLPHAALAGDLIKALQTPALAALISRTLSSTVHEFDGTTRLLPHEAWLAHALELAPSASSDEAAAPFAAAAMRGFGLAQEAGARYFLIHPVHIEITRKHLTMDDMRQLQLSEADSRTLFELARPYFDGLGQPLYYGDAHTWFMRADGWTDLRCASPDAAASQNLADWMPDGEHARASRRLQNEVQMLWHEHPVNEAREARGLKAVNGYWLWGAAEPKPSTCASALHVSAAPGWLSALAEPSRRDAAPAAIIASPADALVVHAGLVGPAMAQDWGTWLAQMQELEQHWFAPLLAALKEGRLGQLRLVLSHRDGWLDCTTSKHAQRKFWRAHTLNTLSTS